IQGAVLVDTAPAGLRLKGRTPVSLAMGHDGDLRACVIRKSVRRDPARDGRLNFLPREVRAQRAVALGEPAADVAGEADPAGHDLLDDDRQRPGTPEWVRHLHKWGIVQHGAGPHQAGPAPLVPHTPPW